MDGVPTRRSQRHHGGTLGARKDCNHLIETLSRHVHQHIFLILSSLDSLDTEEQVLKGGAFLVGQVLVGNQQRLALHHDLHFAKVIAHEGGAGADDIEDAVGQTDARADLN